MSWAQNKGGTFFVGAPNLKEFHTFPIHSHGICVTMYLRIYREIFFFYVDTFLQVYLKYIVSMLHISIYIK